MNLMNCLPFNVKTFINSLLTVVTLANSWCGKMVFSFASKTFLTISWRVSYFILHVFSDNKYNHIVFFLFRSHWYLSRMCHPQHLICHIFQFFATGFYFVLQLCIGQYTVSGLNLVPSGEFLTFFFIVYSFYYL